MDDRTTGASPHELLLALAGRIDDDLLAWCRELVAVGEDGHAVELLTATLIADRTVLPARARAAVVAAARAARTDLDADAALVAAETEYGTPHRFDAGPSVDALAAAVGALPARQVAGCRTWVTSRLTPAGTAPGPLPHPVVLVEVAEDTRPVDVLAYQMAIACERAGQRAAVEVVVAGADRPQYQQEALRTARPVHVDGAAAAVHGESGPREPGPGEFPAVFATADAFATPEVRPEPVAFLSPPRDHRPAVAEAAVAEQEAPEPPASVPAAEEREGSGWRAARGIVPPPASEAPPPAPEPLPPVSEPAAGETPVPEPSTPEPPATRRRSFAPLRGLAGPDGRPGPARTVTPLPRPATRPGPLQTGHGTPRPLAPVADDGTTPPILPLPAADTDTPEFASLGDPLSEPVEPEPHRETVIDEDDPLGIGRLPVHDAQPGFGPAAPAADSWLADWISGDWAMPRSALDGAAGPLPPVDGSDLRTSPRAEAPASRERAEPPPADRVPQIRPRVEIDRVDPPSPRRPVPPAAPVPATAATGTPGVPPESEPEQTGLILRPESAARLSESDRELLARLQADLGEGSRRRVTRQPGIDGDDGRHESSTGTNGRGQRPAAPPDMTG